jgi:acetyl-CoA C-acetyltransferase
MADAGIESRQLQAAWLGCYEPFLYGFEGNSGTFVSDPLNLFPIPVTRVAAYCATGIEAVRNAALAVASGEYDLVLAIGAEKMREVPSRGSLVAQAVNRGHPVLAKGRTAPGMFALLATRYFKEYGASEEALGAVATKNHYHGSLNPKAHFQKEITPEMHAKAPKVAEPLGLFDCCPTTDGAAAAILTRAELAPKFTDRYSIIRGIAYAVTAGYWNTQFDPSWNFTSFRATREAAKAAYHMAGINNPAREIKVAECHDCFTITEIVNYEDLGFFEPGTGWRAVQAGETRLGGSLPVNTSGGLKSCGHPIGSSGIRMINNVHDQLLGRAGKMQVAGANMGLAHNLGGPGSVSAVAVLSQP